MIDTTVTMLAYMLGHGSTFKEKLRLHVQYVGKQNPKICLKQAPSPLLRWSGVPPEASSLALLIKENSSLLKKHFDWVLYNLPVEARYLPSGSNHTINLSDVGFNSWGKKKYHPPCFGNATHPLSIELFALDKRFSAKYKMTGEELEKKMRGHILAETVVRE